MRVEPTGGRSRFQCREARESEDMQEAETLLTQTISRYTCVQMRASTKMERRNAPKCTLAIGWTVLKNS